MNLPNLEANATSKFLEEVAITIVAKDLNPTMVSQDFLKFSGIIPKEWELSQQPVLNPGKAQLNFKNGVSINAQPGSITFNESASNKKFDEINIPNIAAEYAKKLPHADYIGVSFNPKVLLPFPNNHQTARKYITGQLLGSGSWKEIGKAPVQAGLNLMYVLDRCQLNISIAEAKIQQPKQPSVFAVLFSGSFNYILGNSASSPDKLNKLIQALNFWRSDLTSFREIVTDKFLESTSLTESPQEESVFPTGTM